MFLLHDVVANSWISK